MIPVEIKDIIKNFYLTKIQPRLWLFALLIILVIVAYGSVLFLGNDNKIEQEIEEVIADETGVKIDLTP